VRLAKSFKIYLPLPFMRALKPYKAHASLPLTRRRKTKEQKTWERVYLSKYKANKEKAENLLRVIKNIYPCGISGT